LYISWILDFEKVMVNNFYK